jgi:acetylglutamate synthase
VKSVDFEEALAYELSSINGLEEKVFPMSAKEGIKPPFVIYVSSEGIQDKTLDGFLNSKEIECEIHVIHNAYREMKGLTKEVLSKLQTFFGRSIGIDGPFVKSFDYDKPVEVHEKELDYHISSFDTRVRL